MSLYRQIKKPEDTVANLSRKQPIDVKEEAHQKVENMQNLISPVQELKEKVARVEKKERRPDEKLVLISVRIHEDDLAYFKRGGGGYQAEIRSALREYVDRNR